MCNSLCNYPRYDVIVKDVAPERPELREEIDRNERLDRFEDLVCFLNFDAAPYRRENRAEIITRPLVMLQLRRWRGGGRRGKLAARLIMPSLPRFSSELSFSFHRSALSGCALNKYYVSLIGKLNVLKARRSFS